ncbi:MAG TPA: homoserine dehydrogenase [Blastocatellia bacterium]|nr:homoserine dehydrogenase [Blastocatellia bacterium]
MKLAFIGFGNVARAFARLLRSQRARLEDAHDLRCRTTGIATASHGSVLGDDLDLDETEERIEAGSSLSGLTGSVGAEDSLAVIESCGADLIFETTPLNPVDGEPAIGHIRRAFDLGMSVATANKGPLAFAYRDLLEMAKRNRVGFRFEGAVMDGTPVFNLVRECLPAVTVEGFSGVLNSTTNYILTKMEEGRSFQDALAEAVGLRIAEANPAYDVDGWDAAVKAVALANVLMGADVRPRDVRRKGIGSISEDEVKRAAASGAAMRLIASAERGDKGLRLIVEPRRVPLSSPLGIARGTSSVLVLKTDLMGEITIVESDPGIEQTGYALLSDLLSIHEFFKRRPIEWRRVKA